VFFINGITKAVTQCGGAVIKGLFFIEMGRNAQAIGSWACI
jgi:hypothetical protein